MNPVVSIRKKVTFKKIMFLIFLIEISNEVLIWRIWERHKHKKKEKNIPIIG